MRELDKELAEKTKFQKRLSTFILLVLLVGFPMGSWYYLKAGMNYQLKARAELGDLGKIKNFNLPNQNDIIFSPAMLKGKFLVVGFLDPDNKNQEQQYLDRLAKLNKQFGKRPDVFLISNLLIDSTKAPDYLHNYALRNGYDKNKHCVFLKGNKQDFQNLANIYHLPKTSSLMDVTNSIAFVDTVGTVLNTYDATDMAQLKRMVEHIAIVIPKDAIPKVELRREEEK
ncbi:MAG TPA: hypothetical protein ENI82_03610 [Bacteroidetes bacterium]|nr:hypothetical protein [Bacteroidota bacterium]